jgi:hypothetical protein
MAKAPDFAGSPYANLHANAFGLLVVADEF